MTVEAQGDVDTARSWYEDQKPGLGADFVREALDAFDRIGESPTLYPAVHRRIRRVGLKTFKYSAYYRVLADHVEVVGVIHDRRDLVNLLKRL